MDKKCAVIEYEAPRVLRMDLTNQPQVCHDGAYAANCTMGDAFVPQSCGEDKKGKETFRADINPLCKHLVVGTVIGRFGGGPESSL